MPAADPNTTRSRALRVVMVYGILGLGFSSVGVQLVRLGLAERAIGKTSISRPLAKTYARPDIVDRNGNIFATDVVMQSLFADPANLLSANETLATLNTVLPGIDTAHLRSVLANRKRRFVWLRRGLSPAMAQRIHDLGLPGLDFKSEPKRSYPQGRIAGHLIGHVNIDNKGTAGIEHYIDEHVGIEHVVATPQGRRRALHLTIDLPAQAALEAELAGAMRRYSSTAASGVVLDVDTGAVRAAASLPTADPGNPLEAQHLRFLDRLKRGTYELGSIFKTVTIAMALDNRKITTRTKFDVRQPIELSRRFTISDHQPADRPLSVTEIFVRSSNVGAGLIALKVGGAEQRRFLAKLGLLKAIKTDAGPTAAPLVPSSWGRSETVTIAYGHGLAVAPLQFAAAGAALVNGGHAVAPRFVKRSSSIATKRAPLRRVISARTSADIRRLMRLNVTSPIGSGRRADVEGYEVGGKTGTADRASTGGYDGDAVIASFFAVFPISKPRFVVLVTLHDPKPTGSSKKRSASLNAAPTAGRIIKRVAPLLGVVPKLR